MLSSKSPHSPNVPQLNLRGIHLTNKPPNSLWDISCNDGLIEEISEYKSASKFKPDGRLVAPSLCHPHIHLDKCFLLSHPKYEDLDIEKGDFQEALKLTNEAKSRFEYDDLMERGQALIEESISFGVTVMRAFVEVDLTVGMKCLDAGLALKEQFRDRCHVQICVFAQNPVFVYEDGGVAMRALLESAIKRPGVEAFGSTPYVENGSSVYCGRSAKNQEHNIFWTISTAISHRLHVDFHIDYNLDPNEEVYTNTALQYLIDLGWNTSSHPSCKTVTFGHCTRLTLFDSEEWRSLRDKVKDLPVSFVGLPTSDIFMMGRKVDSLGVGERTRGTLQISHMIKDLGLNGAIGINNVGNAFTPHGSCDPLSLASFCVGLYHAGTKADAEILYQCVSSRAKSAIGASSWKSFNDLSAGEIKVGDNADFVVFGIKLGENVRLSRVRKTCQDLVNDAGKQRKTVYDGVIVTSR